MNKSGFPLLARLANWHRFVRHDGQISIGRSFVPADWHRLLARAEVPATEVVVQAHVPFRLTVARCIGSQPERVNDFDTPGFVI